MSSNRIGRRQKAHVCIRINPKIIFQRDLEHYARFEATEYFARFQGSWESGVYPMYGYVGGSVYPFSRYGQDLEPTWNCTDPGYWFEEGKGKEWNKW